MPMDLAEHAQSLSEPQDVHTPTLTTDRAWGPLVAGNAGSEIEVHEAPAGTGGTYGQWGTDNIGERVAYDIGGQNGWVRTLPYSIGPVVTTMVEDFELRGRILVPGRPVEQGDGPVGQESYRSQLILQIVQAMGPEVTDEMQAIGLLSGV